MHSRTNCFPFINIVWHTEQNMQQQGSLVHTTSYRNGNKEISIPFKLFSIPQAYRETAQNRIMAIDIGYKMMTCQYTT